MLLSSAVALARGGSIDWSRVETARLEVRPLSDRFIESYLDAEWPEVGYCVGVFRLEGRGVQLFDRIDGDHFTILGMPLLPLLGALRERGLLLA
jgi:septum formation protein